MTWLRHTVLAEYSFSRKCCALLGGALLALAITPSSIPAQDANKLTLEDVIEAANQARPA